MKDYIKEAEEIVKKFEEKEWVTLGEIRRAEAILTFYKLFIKTFEDMNLSNFDVETFANTFFKNFYEEAENE